MWKPHANREDRLDPRPELRGGGFLQFFHGGQSEFCTNPFALKLQTCRRSGVSDLPWTGKDKANELLVYFTVGQTPRRLLGAPPGSVMSHSRFQQTSFFIIFTHDLTALQLKIIRALPGTVERVPVEQAASEVPSAGWRVGLAGLEIPLLRRSRRSITR